MLSVLSSRRVAATVAGAALLSLSAACGGSGNAAICSEAPWSKAFTDYTTSATATAGDLNKFNEANAKLAADLKELAGKADGDLAAALNDLSATWASLKVDPKDPAASSAALGSLGTKTQEAVGKLAKACS